MAHRPNLSRARIIDAAARVADRSGLPGVSMRTVGRELGVEAMSLYHHVPSKDVLLDDLADWVFLDMPVPRLDAPWRPAMAARARQAREALSEHPWALGLIESRRSAGPALLRRHDATLGCLRRNGFPVALAAHAMSVLDAYVHGFVLTEVNLPIEPGESAQDFVAEIGVPLGELPFLAEMVGEMMVGQDYAYADEFDYGLDLVLDGLAARLAAAGASAGTSDRR